MNGRELSADTGPAPIDVTVCDLCGTAIGDATVHAAWHTQQDAARQHGAAS